MKSYLWSKLKEYSDRNLLWNYTVEKNEVINSSNFLLELTQLKLQKIAFLKRKSPNNLNIIVAGSNSIDFLAVFLAAVISEVNIFICDPDWQEQEWQQALSLVRPDFIFAEQRIKDLISAISKRVNLTLSPDLESVTQSMIMIPTGGSSGKVKFVMHNWSTLSASAMGFKQYFDCAVIHSFCTLPLYHVSGLMQFIRSFITQGNVIICSYKIVKNRQIIFDSQNYFISLVPTQLRLLIELKPSWLRKFKTVLLGGANISRSLLIQARELNISLAPTYGMTETASQIATLKPEDFLAGNSSSGKVLPHAKIILESKEDGSSLIKLKCDSLCLGYYPNFFDLSHVFATDDLGYIDDLGYLYLVGRNSHKIITGGKNVFPEEVESAILGTKLVQDVCIVGTSDRKWGEVVTAVYVPLTSKQDLELIKDKVKLQLAKYKQPKEWIEVNSLPRNNRGKINYLKVKAIAKQVIAK